MSIRKRLLKEDRIEQFRPSTQFLDLMLQKPQGTEDKAVKECGCSVKLIGVGELSDDQLKLMQDEASKMEKTDKCYYKCMNYRGYPVIIKQEGPMNTATHLVLIDKENGKIHKLEVSAPKLGLGT